MRTQVFSKSKLCNVRSSVNLWFEPKWSCSEESEEIRQEVIRQPVVPHTAHPPQPVVQEMLSQSHQRGHPSTWPMYSSGRKSVMFVRSSVNLRFEPNWFRITHLRGHPLLRLWLELKWLRKRSSVNHCGLSQILQRGIGGNPSFNAPEDPSIKLRSYAPASRGTPIFPIPKKVGAVPELAQYSKERSGLE